MITVTTDQGTFTGATIVSVIHEAFGMSAQPMRSPDPDSPHFGVVVLNEQYGTDVIATILRVDEH